VDETDRLVGLCDEDEPGWRGDGGGRGMGCFDLVGVEDGEDGIDCDMVESHTKDRAPKIFVRVCLLHPTFNYIGYYQQSVDNPNPHPAVRQDELEALMANLRRARRQVSYSSCLQRKTCTL